MVQGFFIPAVTALFSSPKFLEIENVIQVQGGV